VELLDRHAGPDLVERSQAVGARVCEVAEEPGVTGCSGPPSESCQLAPP
jgi:hypothetical protein